MGTEGGSRPLAGTMIAPFNTRVSSLASMSALPPKADIGTRSRNDRFVPKADILCRSK
jgi:hypothetical protein